MPAPLSHSSLIFPSASISISTTLTFLKRSNLSITNRLHSIAQDAEFVSHVSDFLQLPVIANERCGSWYIDTSRKAGSAYFKSTDGHFGQWSFSLRRLNLQVLEIVGKKGGCIIVDSTRRGKSMPDALSKTIGIWIAVLNRLLFPSLPDYHALLTPGDVVSDSEHSQILARLDSFVREAKNLDLDLDGLRTKVRKPMQPLWVTPATDLSSLQRRETGDEFATVVLCTASSRASVDVLEDSRYVQGAADDSEAWALGLDAVTFWKNRSELLAANEDELPALIAQRIAHSKGAGTEGRVPTAIKPTELIWVCERSCTQLESTGAGVLICCGSGPSAGIQRMIERAGGLLIHFPCANGKTGSRQLRAQLPRLAELRKLSDASPRILVACQTGKDLSVGVALALLCMFCSPGGDLNCHVRQPAPNKTEIKKRLSWIMASMPEASPSRATLQSVNAFLMG